MLAAGGLPADAGDVERWVARHGGELEGAAAARAVAALAAVAPPSARSRLHVRVLDGAEIEAWAWPSGDVVVSAGLLAILDDDELAAAVAHEIGHLLSDDRLPGAAALLGQTADRGGEAAADELGARLLAGAGRSAGTMVGMLRRVQDARGPQHPDFRSLDERIRLLQSVR